MPWNMTQQQKGMHYWYTGQFGNDTGENVLSEKANPKGYILCDSVYDTLERQNPSDGD